MNTKTFILTTLAIAAVGCSSEGASEITASQFNLSAAAQAKPDRHATHRNAAQAGIIRLTGMAKERRKHVKMGFETPDDVDSALLGDGLPIYRVTHAALTAYHRGDNAEGLLVDTDSVFYPAVAGGRAVSGIVVEKEGGDWVVTSLGRPTWARAAQTTRERIVASRGFAPEALGFVEIETPQKMLFLRHLEGGSTLLTPVADLPVAGLHAGESLPIADAVERLQSLAN
jgi:hypothetical protein